MVGYYVIPCESFECLSVHPSALHFRTLTWVVFDGFSSNFAWTLISVRIGLGIANGLNSFYKQQSYVKCLGHEISVRQHHKSEHWSPCRNQTQSWYDWNIVESNVKPEQTTTLFYFDKRYKESLLNCIFLSWDVADLCFKKLMEQNKTHQHWLVIKAHPVMLGRSGVHSDIILFLSTDPVKTTFRVDTR